MQTTFFVALGFLVEDLEAKHYKGHISKKEIEGRIGITLQSLKTYGFISSKAKSYQIQREFLLLFIFLPSKH